MQSLTVETVSKGSPVTNARGGIFEVKKWGCIVRQRILLYTEDYSW
jgi:hypothetical protein